MMPPSSWAMKNHWPRATRNDVTCRGNQDSDMKCFPLSTMLKCSQRRVRRTKLLCAVTASPVFMLNVGSARSYNTRTGQRCLNHVHTVKCTDVRFCSFVSHSSRIPDVVNHSAESSPAEFSTPFVGPFALQYASTSHKGFLRSLKP